MPILFRVAAGRLGRSYANLISILFRVTASRSQTDLIPIISSYSRPILFRVTVGRSYFRTRRNACVTAGKTTMAAGKINYGCFELLFWPHRTSNNIINIYFWFLETCTKCSYFIEENMRPGAQWLAFEVKYEYIVHRSTNTPWACGLRLGKFPDNRRSALRVGVKTLLNTILTIPVSISMFRLPPLVNTTPRH